jgi:hypothetical protein
LWVCGWGIVWSGGRVGGRDEGMKTLRVGEDGVVVFVALGSRWTGVGGYRRENSKILMIAVLKIGRKCSTLDSRRHRQMVNRREILPNFDIALYGCRKIGMSDGQIMVDLFCIEFKYGGWR